MGRSWGDDIFGAFSKDPDVIKKSKCDNVRRDVSYVLGNYKITTTELISILRCGSNAKVDFYKKGA